MNARKRAKEAVQRVRSRDFIDEPKFDSPVSDPNDMRLVRALNYYAVELKDEKKSSQVRDWVVDYVAVAGADRDLIEEDLAVLRKIEDWRITSTMGAMCRMISNGVQFSRALVAKHDARIRQAIDAYLIHNPPKPQPKTAGGDGPRHTPVNPVILAIEEALDSGETFSVYDILTKSSASKTIAQAVAERYAPLKAEADLLKKGDKQVKEAYRHLSRTQINSYVEQVNSIIVDSRRYTTNRKLAVVRKPRKKKEKAASEVAKGVTYLKSHPDLKLVSVDPATIVGARSVWLYSVRYKILRRLVAEKGKTLTLSGSTVKNIDLAASEGRVLRKPDKVLPTLVGSATDNRGLLTVLTTAKIEANGRINSETVIVRAFK